MLWLVALIGTLEVREVIRSLRRPAAALPIAFGALAVLGMLWSVASIQEQLLTLKTVSRLMLIPLLLLQFSRSEKGAMALYAFLVSCTVLMAVSWIIASLQPRNTPNFGVPVKDSIIQSGEFLLCAFALIYLCLKAWQTSERLRAFALAAWALAFLANIALVATSRTSMVVFFVLVVLLAVRQLHWKGAIATLLGGLIFAAVVAALSPYVRERVQSVVQEVQDYRQRDAETSAGYRLEFWKRSIGIIAQAPIIGHGIGSIEEMFRRSVVGQSNMAATVTNNPHNQTLFVAIQLGVVGVIILYAMWIAHALMFWRPGAAAWVGLVVVVQNVVS